MKQIYSSLSIILKQFKKKHTNGIQSKSWLSHFDFLLNSRGAY